jgi:hypothetical protein
MVSGLDSSTDKSKCVILEWRISIVGAWKETCLKVKQYEQRF